MRTIEAQSINNGIWFKSKQHEDYVVMATIDEGQRIKVEYLTEEAAIENNKQMNEKYLKEQSIFVNNTIPFATMPIILSIIYFIFKSKNVLVLVTGILVAIIVFIVATFMECLIGDLNDNLKKFHAAEHMIINAYKEIQRVPTITELSGYSRLSKGCGTNTLIFVLIVCVWILNCIFFIPDKSNWHIIGGCYVIAYFFLWQFNFLNFFQLLVTKTPTQRELEVAIEGLKAWLEYEQKAEEE